jgi:hypothetical protein
VILLPHGVIDDGGRRRVEAPSGLLRASDEQVATQRSSPRVGASEVVRNRASVTER